MRSLLLVLALGSCVAAAGCGDDDGPSVDASTDAPVTRTDLGFDASFPGRPSPDGEGWCCEPATPSCDCGSLGGFAIDPRACPFGGPCDMPPGDHHLMTDEHGCMYYTTPIVPTICECLCAPTPDMGTPTPDDAGAADAGAVDDGGVDAAAP